LRFVWLYTATCIEPDKT